MKPPRPIGMIRLLQPILGRARRRWRGGPLAPMIWRRRPRARAATPQKPAPPLSITHNWAFNLTLIWPAGTAARAGPLRQVETRLRERFRAGRGAGGGETSRLVTLVERLWLRSGEGGPRGTAVQAQLNAPQPALRPPPASGRQDAPDASPPHEGRPASGATAPSRPSREIEVRAAALPRAGAPRVHKARPMRAGAIRHGNEPRAAGERIAPAAPALLPARAPAATTWRAAAALAGIPAAAGAESPAAAASRRPSRPQTSLVWRKGEAGGGNPAAAPHQAHAHRTPAAKRVWRRLPTSPARDLDGPAHDVAASAPGRNDGYARADRPTAPAPAAPAAPASAAMQPAEMSRLVDEVVRRLDRIGRDERMRRGI